MKIFVVKCGYRKLKPAAPLEFHPSSLPLFSSACLSTALFLRSAFGAFPRKLILCKDSYRPPRSSCRFRHGICRQCIRSSCAGPSLQCMKVQSPAAIQLIFTASSAASLAAGFSCAASNFRTARAKRKIRHSTFKKTLDSLHLM